MLALSKFKVKDIIQYFGFFLMAAFVSGNILGLILDTSVKLCLFTLFFSVFLLFYERKITVRKSFFVYILILTGCLIITWCYTSGSLSLNTIGNLLVRYLLVYSIVMINPDKVIVNFLKFAYFAACISLVFYFLSMLIGEYTIYNLGIGVSESVTSLMLYNSTPIHFGRNLGMFGEPGQYQIFLSIALFYSVFYAEHLNKKDRIRYIVVFVVTIVTAQSTAGYICLLGFLVVFIIVSDTKLINKVIISVITILFLFGAYRMGEDSTLYYNLFGKVISEEGYFDLSGGSGAVRADSIVTIINMIKKQPNSILGIGYEKAQELKLDGCASLLGTLITCGIGAWSVIYGGMLIGIIKSSDKIYKIIIAVYIIVVAGLSQPNILNPFLLFLAFGKVVAYSCSKETRTIKNVS